jgi:predicted aldo/keto reductase-like oxidoreductase
MSITPASNQQPLNRNDAQMRYRPLGKTGWEVSALSFGCMRLSDDPECNTPLIRRAIESGVNYFETTRFYLGGQCQHRTAPGLAGKTDGLIVSGKDGIHPNKTAYQYRKEMELQLGILGLSHFKFYQVGWFSWGMVPHLLKPGGVLDAIRQAKAEGLVQRIGFTGHDTPENFIKCIETGLFDSITVPYNLINRSYEPTISRAGELGVGVVAMCPVAGGTLSCESDRLKEALGMDLPTTEMALRFVLSNPHVSTACSGMNAMAQLEQNVKTVHDFDPAAGRFEAMCEGLDRLRAELGDRFCTGCRYCLPCPQGIDIPHYMNLYRDLKVFGLKDAVTRSVRGISEEKSAARCTDCGGCEDKCPNHLAVRELLREVEALR